MGYASVARTIVPPVRSDVHFTPLWQVVTTRELVVGLARRWSGMRSMVSDVRRASKTQEEEGCEADSAVGLVVDLPADGVQRQEWTTSLKCSPGADLPVPPTEGARDVMRRAESSPLVPVGQPSSTMHTKRRQSQ